VTYLSFVVEKGDAHLCAQEGAEAEAQRLAIFDALGVALATDDEAIKPSRRPRRQSSLRLSSETRLQEEQTVAERRASSLATHLSVKTQSCQRSDDHLLSYSRKASKQGLASSLQVRERVYLKSTWSSL
jgi:hypothetical protein